MNVFEFLFRKQIQARADAIAAPLVQKAMDTQSRAIENILNRALYQYRGRDAMSWPFDEPDKYVTRGYATNADLFSVIETILVEAGAIDWVLERKGPDGKWDAVESHEILDIWAAPNPWATSTELVQQAMGYGLLTGNSYLYLPRVSGGLNQGRAYELYVMPAPLVRIVHSGEQSNPYGGFTIQYAPSITEKIDASEVIHIKEWNPLPDEQKDLYGMSPLRALINTLLRSNASDLSQTRLMQNYGPPGIIGPDFSGIDPETAVPFTHEQLKDLKRLYKGNTGPENAGAPFFTSIPWKYQQLGMSSADLKILEAAEVDLKKMCNAYGVPFRLLNDGAGGTYNNMEQDMRRLYTRAVLPRMYRLGEKLTNGWIKPGWGEGLRLRPDVSNIEVLQKNMKDTATWLSQAWWIKGSDKQMAMGFEPDPAMDLYFVPNTLTPFTSLEDALAQEAERAIIARESQQPQQTDDEQ